jgi:hypothetical protein
MYKIIIEIFEINEIFENLRYSGHSSLFKLFITYIWGIEDKFLDEFI